MLLREKIVLRFFPWIENSTVESYKKSFGSHFKFHSNLQFNNSCFNDFPYFYLDIFCNCKNISQPIHKLHREFCLNICDLVINFSNKNINFMSDIVYQTWNFKSWETLENEYRLEDKCVFNECNYSRNSTVLETKNKW